MNNILIFSPTPSHPQNAGNRKRIFNIAQYLRVRGNRIHFVYFTQEGLSNQQQMDMENEWDSLTIINKTKQYKLNGDYYLADDWYQDNIGKIIVQKCKEYKIDIVLVNYIFQSKLLEDIEENIFKIIDTHDCFSNRHTRMIKNGIRPDFFFTIPKEEKKAFDRADLILAIQDQEAKEFQKITTKEVKILGHLEENQFLSKKKYHKLGKIGFIGSGNSVNTKSILVFINNFLDFVDKYNLNITLEIAGNICEKISIHHKAINLLGFIKNEKDFYSSVDLIINPLLFGTGLKIKSIEALSFGVPIIATKIGFEGIKSNDECHNINNLNEMMDSIYFIYHNPKKLELLSLKSREIFISYEIGLKTIVDTIFNIKTERKNILIITHISFWNLDLGSRHRLYFLLEYLKKYFNITIAYVGNRQKTDYEKIRKLEYEDKIIFIKELEETEFNEAKISKFLSENKIMNNFFKKELYSKMLTFKNRSTKFDCVIYEYINLSYFNPIFKDHFSILDTHDLMFERYNKFHEKGKNHWINISEHEELNLFREFDLVLAIQKREYNYLLSKNINSLFVCHSASTVNTKKIQEIRDIIFVGGDNIPNTDSICWFIENVWKFFEFLEINLIIYGRVCERIKERYAILPCNNIYLRGVVDNLEDVYMSASLAINPIELGGGIKIKNIEALANGLPLITTDEGANGIEDGINNAFLLANSKDEWIDCILSLMLSQDLRQKLSDNALEYAKINFSKDACYSELVKKIKSE